MSVLSHSCTDGTIGHGIYASAGCGDADTYTDPKQARSGHDLPHYQILLYFNGRRPTDRFSHHRNCGERTNSRHGKHRLRETEAGLYELTRRREF